MSRRATGGSHVPAASRLEHVLRVGYKNKAIGSADEDNSFVKYRINDIIPMLAVRVSDQAGIFVAKMGQRDVKWALENLRDSSYPGFPWTIEFMDVTQEPWFPFATCTYKRDEDDQSPDSGWTFKLLTDPTYKPVFRLGGNNTSDAAQLSRLAVDTAFDMVKRSGIEHVRLVWLDNDNYLAAYEEAKRKAATPAPVGATSAWGFNPLGTSKFDELVETTTKNYPGKTWICTLKNDTLKRQVAYKNEVTVKVNPFYIDVRFANIMYHVGWDYNELSQLAQRTRGFGKDDELLDNVALDHQGISSAIEVSWVETMMYGGYDRCQASNTGLRKLAAQYKSQDMIKSFVDTMTTQGGTALGELLLRPAARRAVAWSITSGLVACFGGNIQQFVGASAWLVVPEESGEESGKADE